MAGSSHVLLLVDDQEDFRLIVRAALKDISCELIEAQNGQQALQRLREDDRISHILLDFHLDDTTPGPWVDKLTNDLPQARSRVALAVFSNRDKGDAEVRALREKGIPYQKKPHSLSELRRFLKDFVERK